MEIELMCSGSLDDPKPADSLVIEVDGKRIAYVRDFSEDPGNANLGNGLRWICHIPALLHDVYMAGVRESGLETIVYEHYYGFCPSCKEYVIDQIHESHDVQICSNCEYEWKLPPSELGRCRVIETGMAKW